MELNTALVIGGAGAVGSLLCELLLKDKRRVTVLDLCCNQDMQLAGVEYIQGSLNDECSKLLINEAELIILATPEAPAIESIDLFGQLLQPGQCLIDTMSVKSVIVECLTKLNPKFEVVSINPMFGPSLGFQNQSVACIKINIAEISENFLSLIRAEGASVVFFSAEEHDRYTAAIQAATHAAILTFGMTLDKLNYKSCVTESIWTPPHKIMLALLARILSSDPEVYRDIQLSNPFAAEARIAVKNSLNDLELIISSRSPDEFSDLFKRLNVVLGLNQKELTLFSQELFIQLDHINIE